MTREEQLKHLKALHGRITVFDEDDRKQKDALEKTIETLSQEPNKDIEEIAEIMKSDADANTKCKMISNILTAKPHYFEVEQDLCKNCLFGEGTIYCREHCPYEAKTEQEPCDDVISREAVNNLQRYRYNCGDTTITCISLKSINELPSVTQKSREWIPVSERLPESSGVYIVSRWFEDRILTDANYYDGCGEWYNDNRINWGRDLATDKIIAWMPLPKPYERKKNI